MFGREDPASGAHRQGGLVATVSLPRRRPSRGLRATSLVFAAALILVSAREAEGAGLKAELVASGLSFPLFATAPPGDARVFVLERVGRIRIVEGGAVLPTSFLDIQSKVGGLSGEGGLLGLAFAPDFATSGTFYVHYTDAALSTVVSRFTVSGDPDVADPMETVILTAAHPFNNHKGGTIAFAPDGFLHVAIGDGGGSNDPDERAQDPLELLGKMLRLDVGTPFQPGSVPVPGTGYAIPADNPFVGVPGFREEIWALGLRNPYRWSFDRATGDLWIADVGQAAREEIDFEPASDAGGRNWGWDVMEGTGCNPTDPAPAPPCNDPSLSLPRHEYLHLYGRCSITGGYVYRGAPAPSVQGLYFFGDYCTGEIWTLDPATSEVRDRTFDLMPAAGPDFNLVGFGEDGQARLLIVLKNGSVYRVASPDCSDGADNDGDDFVDFPADPGCRDANALLESPQCQDGLNNDLQTGIDSDGGASANGGVPLDVADPHCTSAWRNKETPSTGCGLGFEVALLLPALGRLRRWRPRGRRSDR
jgi:glucose/arabinose dehydrogenase